MDRQKKASYVGEAVQWRWICARDIPLRVEEILPERRLLGRRTALSQGTVLLSDTVRLRKRPYVTVAVSLLRENKERERMGLLGGSVLPAETPLLFPP